jgi:hypothetical protein
VAAYSARLPFLQLGEATGATTQAKQPLFYIQVHTDMAARPLLQQRCWQPTVLWQRRLHYSITVCCKHTAVPASRLWSCI